MKKILTIIILLIGIVVSVIYFISYNVVNNTNLFYEYKRLIPKTLKSDLRNILTNYNSIYTYRLKNFKFHKRNSNTLTNNDFDQENLVLYTNSKLIFTGPRAYFHSNDKDFFLITGTGILMNLPIDELLSNSDKITFKKINTNIDKFTSKYKIKNSKFTYTSFIKDIFINIENEVFVSLIIKEHDNCYKHSILNGKIKLDKIEFKEFFKLDECRIFFSNYVGGNLSEYKDDRILYSVGDWSICEDTRWLKSKKKYCEKNNSQILKSYLGKIFEINTKTKEIKIISIGHDNPQGIFYDKKNDIIFSTEHGPMGGDELNINVHPSTDKIKNYGYPISSYGEHYGYPNENIKYKYKLAPLYKSHKEFGFIEPLDYFVPSIGISDLTLIKNKLFVSSLGANIEEGDLSLYEYELNDGNTKVISKKRYKIYERIRDIHKIQDKYIVLFFETTGTIAIFRP